MKRILIVFVVASSLLLSSFARKKEGPSVVAFSHYANEVYSRDTLVIPYQMQPLSELNDTLTKYLHGRGANVQMLMFAQPTYIIDSIDLSVFPNVTTLEFSGDVDIIENRRYAFMDLENLHTIRCWGMLAQLENPPDVFTHGGNKEVRTLIHRYRPDVKVRFPRKDPPEEIRAY